MNQERRSEMKCFTDSNQKIIQKSTGKYYLADSGQKISREYLQRIHCLGIPPMYNTLWLSTKKTDSLQAIALDSKNRKQYFYSSEWIAQQNKEKYKRIYFFAKMMPTLLSKIKTDQMKSEFSKERVIAYMLRIMELTNIRIGNKKYYDKYTTHGLSTLRKDQIKFLKVNQKKVVQFDFIGKHNVDHQIIVNDPEVVQFLYQLQQKNTNYDEWLFAFQQPYKKEFFRVSAQMVNDYLHDVFKDKTFTCKDFRTYNANRIFLNVLKNLGVSTAPTMKELNENIKLALSKTSEQLGNTNEACKHSYIMQAIIELYKKDPQQIKSISLLQVLKKSSA